MKKTIFAVLLMAVYAQGTIRYCAYNGNDENDGTSRALELAPNLPTAYGYGIIHTNHTSSSPSAFQLASRWSSNNLYYRVKNNGTWEPWVELYHSGTTKIDVNDIQCDTFRLDQTPTSGSITPDSYIIINCNGTNYKIPVVAA